MKVHFIYTKQPEDNWTIYLADRSSTDIDPRDPPLNLINISLQEKYGIVLPYRSLYFDSPYIVSCDRKYIDDNTLDVFYVFNLDSNMDPIQFGKNFISHVFNMENPIVSNYLNWLKSNSTTKYSVQHIVEDNNGNITII